MPTYFDTPLASIGKEVRVRIAEGADGGRCRRAVIEYVDEGDATADVVFIKTRGAEAAEAAAGGQVDEATVRIDALQPLEASELSTEASWRQHFEEDLYRAAAATKDAANALFKLRDFEAAIDMYSRAIEELQRVSGPDPEACGAEEGRPVLRGTRVLANQGGCLALGSIQSVAPELEQADVLFDPSGSESAEGCLVKGAPWRTLIQVHVTELQLQTGLYMNRARSWSQLGCHQDAAPDLSIVIGLWSSVAPGMLPPPGASGHLPNDGERRDALLKAFFLRAKGRVARMRIGPATADLQAAWALDPPDATAKLLRQLERDLAAAKKEQARSNKRIAKEIAKLAESQLDEELLARAFGAAAP